MAKNIYLLGSTGSIGSSTLNVIRNNKKKFSLKLLTTNNNVAKIYKQAKEFHVPKIIIFNKEKYLKNKIFFKKKKYQSL